MSTTQAPEVAHAVSQTTSLPASADAGQGGCCAGAIPGRSIPTVQDEPAKAAGTPNPGLSRDLRSSSSLRGHAGAVPKPRPWEWKRESVQAVTAFDGWWNVTEVPPWAVLRTVPGDIAATGERRAGEKLVSNPGGACPAAPENVLLPNDVHRSSTAIRLLSSRARATWASDLRAAVASGHPMRPMAQAPVFSRPESPTLQKQKAADFAICFLGEVGIGEVGIGRLISRLKSPGEVWASPEAC